MRLLDGEVFLTVRKSRKVLNRGLEIPKMFKCISQLLPRLSTQTNRYFLFLF